MKDANKRDDLIMLTKHWIEDQGNILDDSNTSSSKSKNEKDNLMVNIRPLDETLGGATP